jgi:hypothetical protein
MLLIYRLRQQSSWLALDIRSMIALLIPLFQSFTRHHVKGCDYPAIVPYNVGSVLLKRELGREDRCVRGVIVSGLTPEDIALLDVFEGDVRVVF